MLLLLVVASNYCPLIVDAVAVDLDSSVDQEDSCCFSFVCNTNSKQRRQLDNVRHFVQKWSKPSTVDVNGDLLLILAGSFSGYFRGLHFQDK